MPVNPFRNDEDFLYRIKTGAGEILDVLLDEMCAWAKSDPNMRMLTPFGDEVKVSSRGNWVRITNSPFVN